MSTSALLAHRAGLLAHQGGWDEALFVAVPMVIVAVLLKLAKRRMAAATAKQTETADEQHVGVGGQQPAEVRTMPAPTAERRPTRSS